MYGRRVIKSPVGVAPVVDVLRRLQVLVDLISPCLTEMKKKILGVEWVLLHVDTLPLLTTVAIRLLLSVLGQQRDSFAVFVQYIRHFSFTAPFTSSVDWAIGYEYMSVCVPIFLFIPVMYGIGDTIALFCDVVLDVVLDDFFLF